MHGILEIRTNDIETLISALTLLTMHRKNSYLFLFPLEKLTFYYVCLFKMEDVLGNLDSDTSKS